MTKPNPKSYVFTRQSAVQAAVEQYQDLRANVHRTLKLNIPKVRDYFAPVFPGQVVALQGQSSSGKSLFMKHWLEDHAQELAREERQEIPVVIHLEDTIEEVIWQEIANRAGVTIRQLGTGEGLEGIKLESACAKVAGTQILHIAYSLTNPNEERCLSLKFIKQCIEYGLKLIAKPDNPDPKVSALYLDYLQILAENDETIRGVNDQRRLRVRGDMYGWRGLAQYFKAPSVINIQSRQVLTYPYNKDLPIPGLYDGEESSTIGQNADRILSVAMPKMFNRRGTSFKFQGETIPTKDNHQFLWVVKQRGGLPSGQCFLLYHDFEKGIVSTIKTD